MTKIKRIAKIGLLAVVFLVAIGVYLFHPYFRGPRQAVHVFNSIFSFSIDEVSDLELLSQPEGLLASPSGCVEIRFKTFQKIKFVDQSEYHEAECPSKLNISKIFMVPKDTPLNEFKCWTAKRDPRNEFYSSELVSHPGTRMYFFWLCS